MATAKPTVTSPAHGAPGTLEAEDYAAGGEYLRSGQIRPLAVFSDTRIPGLPDVPTAQEALDLRGFEAYAWQGLVLPKRTPDAEAGRLSAALAAGIAAIGASALKAVAAQGGSNPKR